VKKLLAEARAQGYQQVKIIGDSEIADVCQLTCLEQGFEIVDQDHVPILEVTGYTVKLHLEEIQD
jgi:hypothetical protein